jgi:hypothetical protein
VKLRDGQSRVSIVELDGDLVGEFLPGTLALLETTHNIVQRGGTPEVLLLKTKLLAALEIVVGVQDSRDSLSALLIRYGALVLSRVELLEIELATGSLAAPETEVIASTGLGTS